MRHLASLFAAAAMAAVATADCTDVQLFHSYSDPGQLSGYLVVDSGITSGPSQWLITNGGQLRQQSNIYTAGEEFPARTGTLAWLTEPCRGDFVLRTQVKPVDNDGWGIVFRATSRPGGFDGYRLFFSAEDHPGAWLHRCQDGVWTELAYNPNPGITLGDWQEVELRAQGQVMELNVNGQYVFEALDDQFVEGNLGLLCWAMNPIEWDNLLVSPPLLAGSDPYADAVLQAEIQPGNNGNSASDPAMMVGAPDNLYTSMGGQCAENPGPAFAVFDMGPDSEAILDGPGADLEVIEIGSSSGGVDENYLVQVGDGPDGPWTTLGTGVGSSTFDLSVIGRCSARYIRLEDLSTATCNSATPGSDIDALVALHPGPEGVVLPPVATLAVVDDALRLSWSPVGCTQSYVVERLISDTPYPGVWEVVVSTTDTQLDLGPVPYGPDALGIYRVRSVVD